MSTAATLYARHSKADLLAMQQRVSDDPANKAQAGLSMYTSAAHKRLTLIAAAIAMHMADARAAQGRPVPTCGYSGRQSNRR